MDHQDLCPGSVGVAGGMRPWGVGGRRFREVGRRGLGWPDKERGPLMMRRYSLKLAAFLLGIAVLAGLTRPEERRVGKECRSRWSPYH